MELVTVILLLALCCVCVSWRCSVRESKDRYDTARNLIVENQCFHSLKYYEWQILKNKNIIIQELADINPDMAPPNYEKIMKALEAMKYFYSQRQKALDRYDRDKKELEENG